MTSRFGAKRGTFLAAAALLAGLAAPPARAADFYAGKTIDLEVGADVGAAATTSSMRACSPVT